MNASTVAVDTVLEKIWFQSCDLMPAAIATARSVPYSSCRVAGPVYDKLAEAVSIAERWLLYFSLESERLIALSLHEAYLFNVRHRRRMMQIRAWLLAMRSFCQ